MCQVCSVRIDIWSDVICPWCFLGKRRLERALTQLSWADEVQIRWRAFQLDPTARAEPGDLKRSVERKYGPGTFEGMTRRLTALGEPEGITYRFDTALRVNTLDAHRLSAWAWDTGGEAAQGPLVERLFRAYFEDGANVADHATLVDLAAEAGLQADAAASALEGGAYADEVAAELLEARERELTGVPAFVLEDKVLIPGAQEVETFVAVLDRTRMRLAEAKPPSPA
jgi:predicted DsbA family dithiol-disulfide isomerase